jgi:arylsulfatase A-like enzyme
MAILLINLVLAGTAEPKPNVLLIVCDDLNDYVEPFGGHPQVKTPHMKRLAQAGVRFMQAHCNIPICNPSRASFLTGLYPHTSQCYGFEKWDGYEVLKNSRTMMDHFRQNGYHALGTGKLMHNRGEKEWTNLALSPDHAQQLASFRKKLLARIPESKPRPTPEKSSGQIKRDAYFKKHPEADTNKNGVLTWQEYQVHKKTQNVSKMKEK